MTKENSLRVREEKLEELANQYSTLREEIIYRKVRPLWRKYHQTCREMSKTRYRIQRSSFLIIPASMAVGACLGHQVTDYLSHHGAISNLIMEFAYCGAGLTLGFIGGLLA